MNTVYEWLKKWWFVIVVMIPLIGSGFMYAQKQAIQAAKQHITDSLQTSQIFSIEKKCDRNTEFQDTILVYLKAQQMYQERLNERLAKEILDKAREEVINGNGGGNQPDTLKRISDR